ncbi:MAG: PASTA domain-containing protein, partial [Thermomicrobia bacterium]|nr:PASTA domain-containing protein [Thermomicrobia bacterium]
TPTAGTAQLPDVIGKTPDEAKQILTQKGFTDVTIAPLSALPGGVAKQKKNSVAGIITAQQPFQVVNPGQQIPTNTPLFVVVQTTE